MTEKERVKIFLGKMGLDAHDTGLRVVAKMFRDAGFEVIYGGLHNTAEAIVKTAIQEDVDVIGLSFLSGGHLRHCTKLLKKLKEAGREDIMVIAGGIIPPEDVEELISKGLTVVFSPGSFSGQIIGLIKERLGLTSKKFPLQSSR